MGVHHQHQHRWLLLLSVAAVLLAAASTAAAAHETTLFSRATGAAAATGTAQPDHPEPAPVADASLAAFRRWALQHNKPYALTNSQPAEFALRFQVWSANLQRINERNRQAAQRAAASNAGGAAPARFGLNAHSDLTADEFRSIYLSPQPWARATPQRSNPSSPAATSTSASSWLSAWRRLAARKQQQQQQQLAKKKPAAHWRYENVTAPPAVDWRLASPPVLGAIKDQHVNGTPCGSCWAFSAVSIMEIASSMATGKVVLGSEQQLIDCDRKWDHGCQGGGWLNAIQYTIKNRGLASEAAYPYMGKDGTCKKHLAHAKHKLRVDSWEDVPFSNETALAQAVSQTPVIVAICVGPALDDWHAYAGGVYDSPCCEKAEEVTLDHGIVVVGYGEEGGVPFWVLKNSWGTTWGEHGFMKIRRNHGRDGKCALASYPAMVFRHPLPAHHPHHGHTQQEQQQQLGSSGAVVAS